MGRIKASLSTVVEKDTRTCTSPEQAELYDAMMPWHSFFHRTATITT